MSQQHTEQAGTPSVTGHPHGTKRPVNYDQRPMLVFWETTRACQLACKHCRASATPGALPGELTHDEGIAFIDSIAGFGRPHPILVLTGGDCLLRPDIFELVDHATSLGIPTALSPSVTPMLTPEAIQRIVDLRRQGRVHQPRRCQRRHARGRPRDPWSLPRDDRRDRALKEGGLTVQINTTVMSANLHEMPAVAALLSAISVDIREVFFLVHVGRGVAEGALTPAEHEDVFCRSSTTRRSTAPSCARSRHRSSVASSPAAAPRAARPPAPSSTCGCRPSCTSSCDRGPAARAPTRRGHARRQGHRLRRARRRRLPRGLPPAQARERPTRPPSPTSTATTRTSRASVPRSSAGQCGVCAFADMWRLARPRLGRQRRRARGGPRVPVGRRGHVRDPGRRWGAAMTIVSVG